MTNGRNDAEAGGGPVVRDKRRLDPKTGEIRDESALASSSASERTGSGGRHRRAGEPPAGAEPDPVAALEAQLKERTADLQRVQAEYANYRKRVERDRMAVREQAVANVLATFLPILDDIGRAREHGELTGGFARVAEALETAVEKLGLESFGEKGEAFDPMVHEALMHSYSADVAGPTCVQVLQPGYRVAGRILRPARVAVAEPAAEQDTAPAAEVVEETEPAAHHDGTGDSPGAGPGNN